ncbi:DUF4252 domain-containing protein [Porphyromonas pogonae]|uniref:DUF4252 domain-containing protein n=1 Tax=Porphyromonas pogonae TaxID=867595 RepID=UPI002E75D7AC|nr:DUF4252 domain-containing protein [Porphyromonas pogonae]
MKKISFKSALLVILLILISYASKAQGVNFQKLMNIKEINTVYITEAMLKNASGMIGQEAGSDNKMMGDMVKSTEQMYVFTAQGDKNKQVLKQEFEPIMSGKDKKAEVLMISKNGNNENRIIGYKNNKGGYNTIYIINEADSTMNIVSMLGNFSKESIKNFSK